jgi:hypothetical protein
VSGLTGVIYAPYAPSQPMNGAQAMPNVAAVPQRPRLNARIDGNTPQTVAPILRTVKRVPLTNPITKAWLTVKDAEASSDGNAVLQLIITTALTGQGQITDDGHSTGIGKLSFLPTEAQDIKIAPGQAFVYDIQVLLQDGTLFTGEKGKWLLEAAVTAAVS